jgi:hypothetical protein
MPRYLRCAMTTRALTALAAVASVAACSAQSSGGAGSSGLYGRVLVNPGTPVCRQGGPCSKPAAGFTFVFVRSGTRKAVTTDARGRYRVRLVPGRYLVRPGRPARLARDLRPVAVTVPSGSYARRNFTYDAGIR